MRNGIPGTVSVARCRPTTGIAFRDSGFASPDAQAYDSATLLGTHGGRDDVVAIDGPWQLDFLAPNFAGYDFTEIWVEVTYMACEALDNYDITLWTDGLEDINGPQFVDSIDHGDGWVTEALSFTIQPSVSQELVALDLLDADMASPVYIDSLIIDSVAVPEPAALLLLCIGGMLLARRR